MYPLKRILAYAIDIVLVVGPLGALLPLAGLEIHEWFPSHLRMLTGMGMGVAALGVPILLIGTLTGLTGRSPGKWITFLKVQDGAGDPPGIAQGILREIVKAFCLGFFFGSIWALQGLVTRRQTFYDDWLDLEVEDLRPTGLTPTQKNFRKYMRDQARRQKQQEKEKLKQQQQKGKA